MTPLQQTIMEYSALTSAVLAAGTGVTIAVRQTCGFLRRLGRVADHLIGDGTPEHPSIIARVDALRDDLSIMHTKIDQMAGTLERHQQQPARRAHQRRTVAAGTVADRAGALS